MSEFRFLGELINAGTDISLLATIRGHAWRVGTGYQLLAADGDYITISFMTPIVGRCIYPFLDVNKTGDEVILSLHEGGTYVSTGSVDIIPLNMDRARSGAPITTFRYGLSTAGTTITGGVEFPPTLVGGRAQGNIRPAGSASSSRIIYLKANTRYTAKATAKGGACSISLILDIIHDEHAQ